MERENIEEKIQDLIDGRLSEKEAVMVHEEINKDEYLRLLYNTLKEVDNSLQNQVLSHPSADFTQHVMKGLHQPKSRSFELKSVLIFLGLVICAGVGLVFATDATMVFPQIKMDAHLLERIPVNVPDIDFPSPQALLKVFYFSLLFIALIYFDRVILRQLFNRS